MGRVFARRPPRMKWPLQLERSDRPLRPLSPPGDWPGGDPWAALAAVQTVEAKAVNATTGNDEHPVALGERAAMEQRCLVIAVAAEVGQAALLRSWGLLPVLDSTDKREGIHP